MIHYYFEIDHKISSLFFSVLNPHSFSTRFANLESFLSEVESTYHELLLKSINIGVILLHTNQRLLEPLLQYEDFPLSFPPPVVNLLIQLIHLIIDR